MWQEDPQDVLELLQGHATVAHFRVHWQTLSAIIEVFFIAVTKLSRSPSSSLLSCSPTAAGFLSMLLSRSQEVGFAT